MSVWLGNRPVDLGGVLRAGEDNALALLFADVFGSAGSWSPAPVLEFSTSPNWQAAPALTPSLNPPHG